MGTVARKIMIAMNGSKYSDAAFEWYINYFYRESDTLIIVFCAENGALLSAPIPINDPTFISKLAGDEEVEIIKLLRSFQMRLTDARQIHYNLKGYVIRVSGRKAGELIVAQAAEHRADILITGSRGPNVVSRSLKGSVSNYVNHYAPLPVLIIPPEN